MEGTRFFTELGAQLPEPIGPLVAAVGPTAALVGVYAALWALIAGSLPGVARRMARTSRESRSPGDPMRYGGLEVYRLWVNKGQEVETVGVESALSALALGRRDGAYLELHVGRFTDVVVAGRDMEPALRALRAQYQGKVQFVPVVGEDDPFAPPISEAVGRALSDGEEEDVGGPLPEMAEVCRSYTLGGMPSWGTMGLADFARLRRGDPVDSGLAQIRDALEVDRGEAAMVQIHLRPATPASVKELERLEESYKKQPRKPKLGSFGWLMFYKSLGEPGRDWARQRGYGARAEQRDPQETYESKRVKERRNVSSLFEARLVAFGRCAPTRRRLLEEAFDKYFGVYEDRTGAKGGAAFRPRGGGEREKLMACLRMPGVWPAKKESSPVMNPSEVAAMWHPLGAEASAYDLRESLVVSVPPPASLPRTGITLAKSNFPGLERPVNITYPVLAAHGRLLGLPGTGKTAAAFRLGEAIIRTPGEFHASMGMFLMDPKSDLFTSVTQSVALGDDELRRRTLILDPGQPGVRAPGMNLLAPQGWMTEHKQARVLTSAFQNRFGNSWGPRMQEYLTNALHACVAANRVLVEEYGEGSRFTLLDLSGNRFLAPRTEQGKDFWEPAPMRAEVVRILASSKNAHRYADVIRFWQGFDENNRATGQREQVGPVTNKIAQLFDEAIAQVFGAPHCDVDFLRLLKDGTIFLNNISKATFGEEGAALFGSLLMNLALEAGKYRYDQFSRGADADRPRECVFLVDEVQDFACREMCDIINQGRAYRTPLWVAHQELAQIEDKRIAEALAGAGTQAYFQCTQKDAALVSKALEDPFTAPVMANLAQYNFVTRGRLGRVSCVTVPIYPNDSQEDREWRNRKAQELRELSSEIHATQWDPEEEAKARAARYGGPASGNAPGAASGVRPRGIGPVAGPAGVPGATAELPADDDFELRGEDFEDDDDGGFDLDSFEAGLEDDGDDPDDPDEGGRA